MTHTSTEQERAEFLQMHADFEREFGPMPQDCKWSGRGFYQTSHHAWQAQEYANKFDGFKAAWQAARRAPAVPQEPTSKQVVLGAGALLGQPEHTADNRHPEWYSAVEKVRKVYLAMLAAAPQPPEVDHIPDAGKMVAAPVQLPEPFTTLVRKKSWSTNCYEASPLSKHRDYGRLWADERVNVYTDQQVLALLAQHGIKTK